jgi:hypothetical protein
MRIRRRAAFKFPNSYRCRRAVFFLPRAFFCFLVKRLVFQGDGKIILLETRLMLWQVPHCFMNIKLPPPGESADFGGVVGILVKAAVKI